MPVIRKPIEVRDTRSIQPVRMPDNPMGQVLERQAEYVINSSIQMGRMLAGQAENYAKDVVRQTVILTNPQTGAPIEPSDAIKEDMGRIARETYDAGIADRMVNELGIQMRRQVDIARNNNPDDTKAFTTEATGYLLNLRSDLPPEFHGAFQSIMNKELSEVAGAVGIAQGQRQKREQIAAIPNHIHRFSQQINQHWAGKDPTSARNATASALEYITSTNFSILNANDQAKYVRDIMYVSSIGRFKHDFNILDKSATELKTIAFALRNPQANAGKLAEYFPTLDFWSKDQGISDGIIRQMSAIFPSSMGPMSNDPAFQGEKTYNQIAGIQFAKELEAMAGKLSASETQAKKMEVLSLEVSKYERGEAAKTKDLQKFLNTQMGVYIELDKVSPEIAKLTGLETGSQMPLTRDHILQPPDVVNPETGVAGLSNEKRSMLASRIKQGGFLPQVVEEVFRGLNTTRSPEDYKNAFLFYRDLQKAPNEVGTAIDFTEDFMTAETLAIFDLMDTLYGDGGDFARNLTQVQEAISRINPELGADETYFNFLQSGREEAGWFSGLKLGALDLQNTTKIDLKVGEWLIKNHGVGGTNDAASITDANKIKLGKLFRANTLLQDRNVVDNATIVEEGITLAKKHYEGVWERNPYMVKTDSKNPLEYFPDPEPNGLINSIIAFDRKVAGNIFKGAENLIGERFNLHFFGSEEWDTANRINLGANRYLATAFDLAIDKRIREAVENEEGTLSFEQAEDRLYEAGVHYTLEQLEGTGDKPKYRILMINESGINQTLVDDYDPREDWMAITGLSEVQSWAALDRDKTKNQLKAKYGPYLYGMMTLVSGEALEKSRERLSVFNSFDKTTKDLTMTYFEGVDEWSDPKDWQGDNRDKQFTRFKEYATDLLIDLDDKQLKTLFDSIAPPDLPIVQGTTQEELKTFVTGTGEFMLKGIDGYVAGQEKASELAKEYVGPDKTGANRASQYNRKDKK